MFQKIKVYIQIIYYILVGYISWFYHKITGTVSEKAACRLEICNQCEHNKDGICDICGCILEAKAEVDYDEDDEGFSIDGCPLKKW